MGGMRKMYIHENEKHSMSWPMTRKPLQNKLGASNDVFQPDCSTK